MKVTTRLALAALLTLALPLTLSAQQERGLTIGARGGVNFSDLAGDLAFDSRIGFGIGVFGGVQLSELWSVFPDLSYQQKGAKDSGGSVADPGGFERTIKTSYVELHVPLVLYPEVDSPFTPRLYAGPYGAIEVGCTKDIEGATMSVTGSPCEEDLEGFQGERVSLKSFDYGIVLGAGLDLGDADRSGFTLDVRYNIGLANIGDRTFGDVNNRVIQLVVGYAHR